MNPAACMALCLTAEQFSNYQTALLLKYPEHGRRICASMNANQCRESTNRHWYCYLEDSHAHALSKNTLIQAFELAENLCSNDNLAAGQLIVLALNRQAILHQQAFGTQALVDTYRQFAIDHPF